MASFTPTGFDHLYRVKDRPHPKDEGIGGLARPDLQPKLILAAIALSFSKVHTLCGVKRHIGLTHATVPQRILYRVRHGRPAAPTVPASPQALHPIQVCCVGRHGFRSLKDTNGTIPAARGIA